MNREPIERLIEILELVRDENFNIATHFSRSYGVSKATVNSHGSTASALGHAALDPWFIEQGVFVSYNIVMVWDRSITAALVRIFDLDGVFLEDLFGEYSERDTENLYAVKFNSITPGIVIHRLKQLLNP